MTREIKRAVVLLTVCAVVDMVSVPGILAAGDDGPGAWMAVVNGLIGVLTAMAAFGLARGAPWAKPLAIGGRVVDALTAVPGLGAAMPAPVIVSVVIVISVAAIVAVVRAGRVGRTTAPSRTYA